MLPSIFSHSLYSRASPVSYSRRAAPTPETLLLDTFRNDALLAQLRAQTDSMRGSWIRRNSLICVAANAKSFAPYATRVHADGR